MARTKKTAPPQLTKPVSPGVDEEEMLKLARELAQLGVNPVSVLEVAVHSERAVVEFARDRGRRLSDEDLIDFLEAHPGEWAAPSILGIVDNLREEYRGLRSLRAEMGDYEGESASEAYALELLAKIGKQLAQPKPWADHRVARRVRGAADALKLRRMVAVSGPGLTKKEARIAAAKALELRGHAPPRKKDVTAGRTSPWSVAKRLARYRHLTDVKLAALGDPIGTAIAEIFGNVGPDEVPEVGGAAGATSSAPVVKRLQRGRPPKK